MEHVSCFLQQPQQPSRAGISWKTGTEKTNAQGPIIIAITVHHLYGKLEKKNKQTKKGAQGPSNHHNYCIHHLYGKPGEKKIVPKVPVITITIAITIHHLYGKLGDKK